LSFNNRQPLRPLTILFIQFPFVGDPGGLTGDAGFAGDPGAFAGDPGALTGDFGASGSFSPFNSFTSIPAIISGS
jgi:hypothetical protein